MTTQSLFGSRPTGGSFTDNLRQALDFASGAAKRAPAASVEVPAVDTEAVAALAGDATPAAPVAADVATEVAAPVADDATDLAAAARAAAEASLADPAYAAAAQQQVDVVVQPNLLIQGQSAPTVIPVDIPVPAAAPNVTIAPATATVIDPATGQAVAAQAAGDVATAPTRGLRSWGADDIGKLFGAGRGTSPAAPVATGAVAEQAVESGAKVGWREQINNAINAARGASAPAAVETVVADAAPAAARPSLLDRIRANAPDLAALRGTPASTAAVADEVVDAAAATGRSGLLDDLRKAAKFATTVNPKG